MITLVTGATGHIGVNLVLALLSHGRKVRILVHSHPWPLKGREAEVIEGNICDPDSLRAAFKDVDCVYHLAGQVSIAGAKWASIEKTNVIGTRNVIEACLNSSVHRLVHFSSIHALQQRPFNCPVDESRPLVNGTEYPCYDRSKAAGEQEVRRGIEKGLNVVIINPTAIIGPYDFEPSLFGAALLTMAKGKLPALITGGFDWVDVRDVAEGAIQAELKGTSGSRYLLSGHWASVAELARIVSENTGIRTPRFICPLWLARAGAPLGVSIAQLLKKRPLFTSDSMRALNSNHNISHEKATRELGYSPRDLRDTITDTLQWFVANGKLPQTLVRPTI